MFFKSYSWVYCQWTHQSSSSDHLWFSMVATLFSVFQISIHLLLNHSHRWPAGRPQHLHPGHFSLLLFITTQHKHLEFHCCLVSLVFALNECWTSGTFLRLGWVCVGTVYSTAARFDSTGAKHLGPSLKTLHTRLTVAVTHLFWVYLFFYKP